MGSVTEVLVQEGDRVRRGAVLARIDAREIEAKRTQIEAGVRAADAVYQDAQTQAQRFRALYADSAATRYQLEQVETGLVRADAALGAARASARELDAVGAYAEIRSPFAGVITRRLVDPGTFVAPGAPILEIQDVSRLRVTVSVAPRLAAALTRGMTLQATIEGRAASAVVEGAVPVPAGGIYSVNAIVENADGRWPAGSPATLLIPDGSRRAILIPAAALRREGDLVGVQISTPGGTELRWVTTAPWGTGAQVEVLSGLVPGDVILAGGH
jgi:RND family efflux transporter MFP subunit